MIYTIKNDPIYVGLTLNQISEIYMSFHTNDFEYFNESLKDIPSNVASKMASSLKTKTKSFLRDICGKCKADFKSVEKDVDKVLDDVGTSIAKSGLTSSVSSGAKKISKIVSKILIKSDDFMEDIADAVDLNQEGIEGKIANALVLFLLILILSLSVNVILIALLGPQLGNIIGATVAAPILEEGGKQIATRNGYPEVYNAIFNFYEFTAYVKMMTRGGIKLGRAVFVRLLGVGMHSVNQLISWASNNPEVGKKLGFKFDTEEDRKKNRSIAYAIEWAIHTVWNIGAVAFDGKINKLLYS